MLVRVAVPVPTLDFLTYAVPDEMGTPVIGARAVVPVGARSVTGIIVEIDVSDLQGKLVKPVRRLLEHEPFLPSDVIALAKWTAEYYGAGAGDTITAVLPPQARGERADAHKQRRVASMTAAGADAVDSGTPKQRELLAVLAGSPGGVSTATLAARGFSAALLTRLVRAGLITIRHERVERDPFDLGALPAGPEPAAPRALTSEQEAAVSRLTTFVDAGVFQVALLHGVTGSGKTEVYLRLAAAVRARGRRTLVLVPEIALTPAVASIFRDAFGDRVAIQHSGLSAGERHDQWQRIRHGAVDVVIGTRSAVFAPLPDLGLVIVDEEHDPSYKQEEAPRYHARDVAIVRARGAGALVLLGSATPSMESYHNATSGRYEQVVLEKRILDRPLAAVTVVDMREEYAAAGPDVVISRPLRDAVAARVERREQVLVLLNRRGFATAIFCRQCAGTLDCPNCSVSLVIHGAGPSRRARCHYCNHSARVPSTCPACAAPYMEQAGFGTERVEAELRQLFPTSRIARLDRDAIRRRGALTTILSQFRDGAIDLLVGTQMIAKGHDFPRVTLVGVISADIGLGMADFRASERTFQLLTQVAGRAGRGVDRGEAIVQTIYPDHYGIQLACQQDYPAFYKRELHFRRAMRYPPQTALINAVVRARTFGQAMDDAANLVGMLRNATARDASVRILGPAPAPLGKLRGEYRAQFLVKGTHRRAMREALVLALAARPDLARRTMIDVDPVSVL